MLDVIYSTKLPPVSSNENGFLTLKKKVFFPTKSAQISQVIMCDKNVKKHNNKKRSEIFGLLREKLVWISRVGFEISDFRY